MTFLSLEDSLFEQRIFIPSLANLKRTDQDESGASDLIARLRYLYCRVGSQIIHVKLALAMKSIDLFKDAINRLEAAIHEVEDTKIKQIENIFAVHKTPITIGSFTFEHGHQAMRTFGIDLLNKSGQRLNNIRENIFKSKNIMAVSVKTKSIRTLPSNMPISKAFETAQQLTIDYPVWAAGLWIVKEGDRIEERIKRVDREIVKPVTDEETLERKLPNREKAIAIIAMASRKRESLNVTELAEKLNVSRQTIYRWTDVFAMLKCLQIPQVDLPQGSKDDGRIEAYSEDEEIDWDDEI
jgi:hypothetical protein